jgi:hypothetical protein
MMLIGLGIHPVRKAALRARLADEVEQMKRGRAMMLAFAAAPSRSNLTAV